MSNPSGICGGYSGIGTGLSTRTINAAICRKPVPLLFSIPSTVSTCLRSPEFTHLLKVTLTSDENGVEVQREKHNRVSRLKLGS